LKTVKLHGLLAKKFGKEHRFDVESPTEAVAALRSNFPGFMGIIRDGNWCFYKTRDDETGDVIDERTLGFPFKSSETLHIMPASEASGIVAGIVITGVLVAAAVTAAFTLLAPSPQAPDPDEREQDTTSGIADGSTNRVSQGHVAPLIYGEVITGTIVVSAGFEVSDITDSYFGSGDGGTGTTFGGGGSRFWTNGFGFTPLQKGGKGGGGQARAAQEDPNTLQSNAIVRTLEVVGAGHNEGLVNGLQSLFLDDTPVANPDGSLNFNGVAIDVRTGDENQTYIEGFPGQEATIQINTEVSQASGAITHTVTDPEIDTLRVTLRLPQLYRQNTENGDLNFHQVSCDIEIQSDGGGFTSIFPAGSPRAFFDGKNTSPYQRDYSLRLPPGGDPWDVRVRRISPDEDLASIQSDTFFDFVTEVTETKLNWPGIAHIGVTANLKQLGSNVRRRSVHWRGLHVQVPTNFDPVARTYTGVWDGTFKTAYTDDPAWCLYDLANNTFYGGGQLTQGMIDKWSFFEASVYCNEMVPDGLGGMEPRYRISAIIRTRQQAIRIFNQMASVFRGAAFWGTNGLTVTQDRPELDADKPLLVPANIGREGLNYDDPDSGDQFSAVIVWWNDIDEGYELRPVPVRDNALIQRLGFDPCEITAWGAPSLGQARRMGLWKLEEQARQSNGVTIPVGPDQSFTQPGQVVKVHDDRLTQNSMGGRLRGATATVLTLDRVFTEQAGQTYTINAILPNGEAEIRNVVSFQTVQVDGVDSHSQVTVDQAFTAVPVVDGVWAIESNVVRLQQFRVVGIEDLDDGLGYRVRGESHDPTSYPRVELNADIAPEPFTDLPSGSLPTIMPGSISVLEYQAIDGDSSVPSVRISWTPARDPRITGYDCEIREADSMGYTRVVGNDETARDFEAIGQGDFSIRVRAYDGLGRASAWVEQDFTLDGGTATLPAVTGLAIRSDNEAMQTWLTWISPQDVRPLRFDVFKGSTAVFANAELIGQTTEMEQIITESGFYFVRTAYMDTRSAVVSTEVTTLLLAAPLWDRTVGRPTTLAELDAAAQSSLDGVEMSVAAANVAVAQAQSDATQAIADAQAAFDASNANASDILNVESQIANETSARTSQFNGLIASTTRLGIIDNGNFQQGDVGTGTPVSWPLSPQNAAGISTIISEDPFSELQVIRVNAPAGVNTSFRQATNVTPEAFYDLEYTLEQISGDGTGSGVLLIWRDAAAAQVQPIHRSRVRLIPDTEGDVSVTKTGVRTFYERVQVPPLAVRCDVLVGSSASLGTVNANVTDYHRVEFKPSGGAEAIATSNVVAIANEETARINADNVISANVASNNGFIVQNQQAIATEVSVRTSETSSLQSQANNNNALIVSNQTAIANETSARSTAIGVVEASLADETNRNLRNSFPIGWADNTQWTTSSSGAPSVVADNPIGDFVSVSPHGFGPHFGRTGQRTVYAKAQVPFIPDQGVTMRVTGYVDTVGDGEVPGTNTINLVGIAHDENSANIGGRLFFVDQDNRARVRPSTTGEFVLTAELTPDDVNAIINSRTGMVYMRPGVEVNRGSSNGRAELWTFDISFGQETSRVSQVSEAVFEPNGSFSRWGINTSVPGADAFIQAQAFNADGTSQGTVAIGADVFTIFNPVGGEFVPVVSVSGGDVIVAGSLTAGAGIFVGAGTTRWPVALEPRDFALLDGESVSYGFDFGIPAQIGFDTRNLPGLDPTDVYDIQAINSSGTGFTLSAKKRAAGTITTRTGTVDGSGASEGFDRLMTSFFNDEAFDGNYQFDFDVNVQFQEDFLGGGTTSFGFANVDVFVHNGSGWVLIGQLGAGGSGSSPGIQNVRTTGTINYTGLVRNSGAAFAAEVRNPATGEAVTDINSVSYETQSSASETSATVGGQRVICTVQPRNA